MEVRNIDPKDDSQLHHGRVSGTVVRVIPARHSPSPNPYRFLIKRALNQDSRAGKLVNKGRVPHEDESVECGKGTETELSDAGEQGWIGDSNPKSERPSFVGSVTSGGIPATSPDSHHAGEVAHRQSSHRLSVVAETVLDGPPATLPINQNAEATEGNSPLDQSLLLGMSRISSPSARSAPNSKQNAGTIVKANPPRLESSSPCASRSSNSTEVIGSGKSDSPFRSFLSYLWSKFFVSPFLTPAFNDPSVERVNGKWRRKA